MGEAARPPAGVVRSPIVVLDRDALFVDSLFGARVQRDLDAASDALLAENRAIEAALEAEERDLTIRREEMEAAAFAELARAFDARVNAARAEQDAKARALEQQSERAQQFFLEQANPVLVALARDIGALVILDRGR